MVSWTSREELDARAKGAEPSTTPTWRSLSPRGRRQRSRRLVHRLRALGHQVGRTGRGFDADRSGVHVGSQG
jgi:hypothetical protein